MISRKETATIAMKQEQEENIEERIGQKQKPERGQFRLQVDRQTKQSFATYEAAAQAGMAIKSNFPILQVSVYDRVASVQTIIELPIGGQE
jgi:hypothetical protein